MKKVFYLHTCSTCQRIINDLKLTDNFELQDIKTDSITEEQLDSMMQLAGSYEALFSRRAMKYKSMGLASQDLSENDYKKLILEEYTFLKRPVTIWNKTIYIGNSSNVIDQLAKDLTN